MKAKTKWLFFLIALLLLSGCGNDFVLIHSKGKIGRDEIDLIYIQVVMMLLVVIPAIGMSFWFAWKYRHSNPETHDDYAPEWHESRKIELWIWGIPCTIILIMAILSWNATHFLDPFRPLDSDKPPVKIEVVAAPYQWIFIYPDEKFATVNEIYVPVNTPVSFTITSDFSMNSFFIPQLGGQIYAMAGMKSQLHLIADHIGIFDGISSNYSGHGFSRMKFKAHAVDESRYQAWMQQARSGSDALDMHTFKALQDKVDQSADTALELPDAAPTPHPVRYFSDVSPNLFQQIVDQYMADSHPPSKTNYPHSSDTVAKERTK